MEHKHTPGPWKWREVRDDLYGCGTETVALLLESQRPEECDCHDPVVLAVREDWLDFMLQSKGGRADAALIAAAPDLLAACEALLNELRALRADGTLEAEDAKGYDFAGVIENAQTAIRKARGEA